MLYADGSCESLALAIECRKTRESIEASNFELASNISFIQPKISRTDDEIFLTCFEKQQHCTVKFFKIGLIDGPELKSNGEKTVFTIQRGIQDVTVAGYAMI